MFKFKPEYSNDRYVRFQRVSLKTSSAGVLLSGVIVPVNAVRCIVFIDVVAS